MRLEGRLLVLIGLVMAVPGLGSCSDSSGPDSGSDPPDPVGPVQAAIDAFRIANPGVLSAIGLVQPPTGPSVVGAAGFVNASRTAEIGPDSRFNIGSITKTFTATMVLQLVEEGRADLDRPVVDYLEAPWAVVLNGVINGPEITVRQALSHRSGIYDYLVSPLQSQLLSDPGRVYTPLEAFQFVTSGPPDFPPGTDFKYSNTNFLMLANIVENLTGQSYDAALEARILSRVGMPSTFVYLGSTASRRAGTAHSYATIGGTRFDVLDFAGGWSRGVGGLISTANDLAKFLKALGSGQLFADSGTLAAMTDLGQNTWYGLGVQIDDQPIVGRCFGHGGHSFGSTAHVRYCPDTGVTFSAFYAGDGSNLGSNLDILDRILRAAL